MFFILAVGSFTGIVSAEDYWNKVITSSVNNAGKASPTSDGGFIVSTNALNKIGLLKITSTGTIDTSFGTNGEKNFGQSSTGWTANRAIQTSSGGYVLIGNTTYYSALPYGGMIIKTLSNGNVDTSFGTSGIAIIGETSKTVKFNDVIETSDHGFIVVGEWTQTSPTSDSKCFIAKVNPNGSMDTNFATTGVLNLKATSSSISQNYCRKIIKTNDGNYVVVGNSQVGAANFFALKINESGSLITSFGNNSGYYIGRGGGAASFAYGAAKTSDGGLIIVGNNSNDALLLKLTQNGLPDTSFGVNYSGFQTVKVVKISTDTNNAFFFDVIQTQNGGYLAVGSTEAYSSSYYPQSLAVKLTANGQLDTNFDYDGSLVFGTTSGFSGNIYLATQPDSNSYTVFGATKVGTANTQYYVLKMPLTGRISGCTVGYIEYLTTNPSTTGASSTSTLTITNNVNTTGGAIPLYTANTYSSSQSCSQTINYSTPTPTPTPTLTPSLTPTPYPTALPPAPPEDSGVVIEDPDFTDVLNTNLQGIVTLGIADIISGAPIALVDIDTSLVSGELIWTDLTGASSGNTSVLHYPGGIANLPGQTGGEFILFVPKGDGDSVLICPGATTLGQVILGCMNGYYLDEFASNVTIANINGVDYWRVTGLAGTGGMSVIRGIKDTLTRLKAGEPADHRIIFGANYGIYAGDNFVVEFDPSNKSFDLSTITLADILLTDPDSNDRTLGSTAGAGTWGVSIDNVNDKITFTAATDNAGSYAGAKIIIIQIGGTNKITNPANVGPYQETIIINNRLGETATIAIPIVDNDRVDITGYVTEYMHFDIDTGVGEVPGVDPVIDCNYDICLIHENGGAGSNYTVDLGELTSAVVNKSNTTSVDHTSGGTGIINSIYFDISTNASGGAVVSVKSANAGLQGPGTNKIPSIGIETGADGVPRAEGEDIPANSGVYGYNFPVASTQLHGSIITSLICSSPIGFCGPELTPKTLFTTNNLPVDTARVRMDLAAAANYTNNPGLYTDTLTFVATATF